MNALLTFSEKYYTVELTAYFGLIGATNECQVLETAWKDPYNRREIEEFIKAWLKRKRKKREAAITEFV
ncbi:hypothetical protein KEJ25_03605 [Candidatus Bathyarchaeota archaeon]|nr:hypothetical protein [Candidatus Bathyarchaeota archaeon]